MASGIPLVGHPTPRLSSHGSWGADALQLQYQPDPADLILSQHLRGRRGEENELSFRAPHRTGPSKLEWALAMCSHGCSFL